MPDRIAVPAPAPGEESRQIAEVISDLHYVLSIVVENAKYLLPGESIEEVASAWKQSQETMKKLVQRLTSENDPVLSQGSLEVNELTGATGKLEAIFVSATS